MPSILWGNFRLGFFAQQLVLTDAEAATTTISTEPTHAVIAPVGARRTADSAAPVMVQLSPGEKVVLVERAGGWVLVVREGKRLGYVEENTLVRLW